MAITRESTTDPKLPSWKKWKGSHGDLLRKATEPQRALLEAAVRFVAEVEGEHTMVRVAGFFLLHAHMGLTPAQVGAAIGRTDRAMRTVRSLGARELLDSVWGEMGRHRKPKLSAEHAGPIALYLVDHRGCTLGEMVGFIDRSFDIKVDPLTLRRFFKAYGLGVLRDDPEEGTDTRPFASGARATVGRSSSSPRRLR
jgi:hypothetical protein